MKKYSYPIKNLDCANCANKIECAINENKAFQNAIVNFNTMKLTYQTELEDHEKKVKEIISKIEPDVKIITKEETETKSKTTLFRFLIGIFLTILSLLPFPNTIKEILLILAYIILLYRTTKTAIKLFLKSKTINENLLIVISCVGAYLVGEHMEGLMVIILYEIGKILEEKAVNKSRKSISDLMSIQPVYANIKKQKEIIQVDPNEVKIGDILVVKQGEKIPLDGIVINGTTSLDTAALTGEAILKQVQPNDEVISGSINTSDIIEIKVTKIYKDSTVNKILELVENATDRKAKTETFVARMAKIYTPIVLLLAVLTAILLPIFTTIPYEESIYRALIFLVISCPCAIAISVPLSYFSGIGRASKEGILMKGSDYLDALTHIKEIVFDKTGTITTGSFHVSKIESFDNTYTETEILKLFAYGEKLSNHPIAQSIIKKWNKPIKTDNIKQYKEHSGKGITFTYEDDNYKIGNANFLKIEQKDNRLYLEKNNTIIGAITMQDEIKKEAKTAIQKLKKRGITPHLFTGDNEINAKKVADTLKIDHFESSMLPTDKYQKLEEIRNQYKNTNHKVAFVGDGVNDAPVLALADIGISMGGIGSSSAIEASDIVIMTDSLDKIEKSIQISNKTLYIIKQNLIFAISTKILVLIASTIGFSGMWQAIFADVGVTLITILNTLRILKK